MQKLAQYGGLAVALITSILAAVSGQVENFPAGWQHPVLVGIGVIGTVVTAITAALTVIKQQQVDIARTQSEAQTDAIRQQIAYQKASNAAQLPR